MWIALIIIAVLVIWGIGVYNGLVQGRNKVKNALTIISCIKYLY